eukprot:SAG31_NODE_1924_length_6902_cov_5.916066_6_plen_90_part_00
MGLYELGWTGALILAIVQFMRAVLAYVQSKTEEMQKQNKALKIAMCACQCCLWCFEKVIKYLSHNAYILVAIDGYAPPLNPLLYPNLPP